MWENFPFPWNSKVCSCNLIFIITNNPCTYKQGCLMSWLRSLHGMGCIFEIKLWNNVFKINKKVIGSCLMLQMLLLLNPWNLGLTSSIELCVCIFFTLQFDDELKILHGCMTPKAINMLSFFLPFKILL